MKPGLTTTGGRPVIWIAVFTALSWLGEVIHNRIELPGLTLLSPENSITALVSVFLFLIWSFLPSRRIPGLLLLLWAMIYFIGGGIISVIPFQFLPFYPEQSMAHYLTHLLYGLAQLPLIVIMLRQIWNTRSNLAGAHPGIRDRSFRL